MGLEFKILKPDTEEAELHEFVNKWFKMYHDGVITEHHLMSRMADLALQMRDPDFKVSGKKEFIVGLNDVKEILGGYLAIGRNGNKALRAGEYLNNCRIEKIQAYGKELEELGEGMTAALTLKGRHISFSMRDYMWPWSWKNEEKNDAN